MSSPSRSHVLVRRYEFEFDVGEWAYGTVQVIRDRRTLALKTCKCVPKQKLKDTAATVTKLRKLCDMDLPHVNRLTDVLEDADHVFLISDRPGGGDLNEWVEQMDEQHWLQEDIIAAYIAQALVALAHCHAHHIYHGDLTPSNILLTSRLPDATVLLGDAGIQAILDPDSSWARKNPSAYTAPELVSEVGRVLGGGAADIWSIGAIAHLLLIRSEPGDPAHWDHVQAHFLRGLHGADDWSERSLASRDFVQRFLQPAGHRPTAAKMLQHHWLRHTIIPRVVHGKLGHEDVHQRILCYMIAVLLVPQLLVHGDFCRLLGAFKQADADYDGLVLRSTAQEVLQEHSVHETTVDTFGEDEIEDALEIADVKGTGVFDFCATAAAAMLAKRLPRVSTSPADAPSRAAELAPLLTDRFFEVYGRARQPTIQTSRIHSQMRNSTGRDLELHGRVDFDELLSAFKDYPTIDREIFTAALTVHAGRGTPIAYAADDCEKVFDMMSEHSGESWEALEGFHGLLNVAMDTCGILPETKRVVKKFLQELHCVQCITVG